MFIKNWLNQLIGENHDIRYIREQLIRIETFLELSRKQQIASKHEQEDKKPYIESPTIIERLHVDYIHVDKYEHNNSFGALGIKSLEGRLNIGANYGVDREFMEYNKKQTEKKRKFEKEQTLQRDRKTKKQSTTPEYRFHSRHSDNN